MGNSLQLLKEQVDCVLLDEDRFRIFVGEDKYILGALMSCYQANNKPDYFALSSIYDTITDLNQKIKYSFYMAAECEPSESLNDHVWFGKPQQNELRAIYFIENMVFRTEILWDMLAQLYNELWLVRKPIDRVYTERFFNEMSQGNNKKKQAISICAYFNECDTVKEDYEHWEGNHKYIKEYRNQMTHRNSPNISTVSTFATELRPPAMFVLKRATEDYLKAVEFIKCAIEEISETFSDFELFPTAKEENNV